MEKTVVNTTRKYPRKAYKKFLTLLYNGKADSATGVEIGEGGMAFSSETKLEKNKKVILNFFLLEKVCLSVRATLVNVNENGTGFTYGVSFDDISIALKRQIRAYVARSGHTVAGQIN